MTCKGSHSRRGVPRAVKSPRPPSLETIGYIGDLYLVYCGKNTAKRVYYSPIKPSTNTCTPSTTSKELNRSAGRSANGISKNSLSNTTYARNNKPKIKIAEPIKPKNRSGFLVKRLRLKYPERDANTHLVCTSVFAYPILIVRRHFH